MCSNITVAEIRTETREECSTHTEQECATVIRDVPEEQCTNTTEVQCTNIVKQVPEEVCKTVTEEVCRDEEKCTTETQCKDVPKTITEELCTTQEQCTETQQCTNETKTVSEVSGFTTECQDIVTEVCSGLQTQVAAQPIFAAVPVVAPDLNGTGITKREAEAEAEANADADADAQFFLSGVPIVGAGIVPSSPLGFYPVVTVPLASPPARSCQQKVDRQCRKVPVQTEKTVQVPTCVSVPHCVAVPVCVPVNRTISEPHCKYNVIVSKYFDFTHMLC